MSQPGTPAMAIKDYVFFDDMAWPGYWDLNNVEYRLRHEQESITGNDLMQAASVMAAYRELILATEAKRRHVVRTIRKLEPPS